MKSSRWWLLFCLALLPFNAFPQDPNPPSIHSNQGAWPICRQWTPAEIAHFAEWIQHLYQAKTEGNHEQQLARLEKLLTDPEINALLLPDFAGEGANPQLPRETIQSLHYVVDCAKLTVTLSAYYAYRRGLPWMFAQVRPIGGGDVRTAPRTVPAGEINAFLYDSPHRFFLDAVTGVCTGNFRVDPGREHSDLSDTVPVAIAPPFLQPGCLYYLDGHVLILANITPQGEPRFIDSTTAPSRDIYAYNGFNAVSGLTPKRPGAADGEYAGCFRGFRMFRWPIADTNKNGLVTKVRRRTDDEMKPFGFSYEQYDRMEELTTNRKIVENGIALGSFQHFFRRRMRASSQINLDDDLKSFTNQWANLLQQRENHVQQAWNDTNQNGPIPFPDDTPNSNVFTARGRWGQHASAFEDTALRAKYNDFIDYFDNAIDCFDIAIDEINLDGLNKHVIWTPADLAAALIQAKNAAFAQAQFTYTNTEGKSVPLSLLDIEKRLFNLSFDPNHPPELRWGALPDSPEAQAAPEKPTPLPDGKQIPMRDTFQRQAFYRSLLHWEPEPSYLRNMFTDGFAVPQTIEERLQRKWFGPVSPPLVPHNGKAAWLKSQAKP